VGRNTKQIKVASIAHCTLYNDTTACSWSYQLQTCHFLYDSRKGKGKAVPLQAWNGPEGSRKLRFPDYMTTQDGGKVVSPTHRPPLAPGNAPGTHFC